MLKIKKQIKEIYSILDEISDAEVNVKTVFSELNEIESKYQKREFDHSKYVRIKNKILSNRSKDEVSKSYNNYIISLKNKLIQLNSKILNLIHSDTSYNSLTYGKVAKKKPVGKTLPPISSLEIGELEIVEAKKEIKKVPKLETPIVKLEQELKTEKKPKIEIPKPTLHDISSIPKPVKLSFFKRLAYAMSAKRASGKKDDVKVGGIMSKEFLGYLLKGKQPEKKIEIFGKTKISPSILSSSTKVEESLDVSKTDILDPYLLEKQIKELKNLISKRKPEVYKASTLGYMSNITVRKLSIYFIEKYPEYFKNVYKSVRFGNIKVLANTYINIVFFLTVVAGLISFPLLILFFSFQKTGFALVLLKTIFFTIIASGFTFWMGFYYPKMKASTRKRSINTNLPFAIDHMSSVIASGVSPSTMFKLISNSREYGEISLEIEKVTNYIDFFGYDILTALKAVALISPSEQFKEFIDGFVSTIETGGDLKQYLSQKSAESLLNYRLERQKYVESLGTYSDIYTGVLIAAPLFFVTALSLVSVLGGKIGGMSVNTIITIGTYVVIPALNLLFLIFLELNQPEI